MFYFSFISDVRPAEDFTLISARSVLVSNVCDLQGTEPKRLRCGDNFCILCWIFSSISTAERILKIS